MLLLLPIIFLPLLYFFLRWIGWFSGTLCKSGTRLEGCVALVTGGNSGIGRETVLELARRGATVITGCRDLKKAKQVAEMVLEQTGREIQVAPLDLSDTASIRQFARTVLDQQTRIDILVNNAGIMMPGSVLATKQGHEIHMGVNHLGHHLLTHLLYPLLTRTGTQDNPSRVINISSHGHKFTMFSGLDIDDENFGTPSWAYSGMFAFHRLYGQSKLAQMYHAKEVSRLALENGDNVVSYSVHPGAVNTEITRYHNLGFWQSFTSFIEAGLAIFGKTPWEGAQTTLYCCLTNSKDLHPGMYYVDCEPYKLPAYYEDPRHQTKLWQVSNRMMDISSD